MEKAKSDETLAWAMVIFFRRDCLLVGEGVDDAERRSCIGGGRPTCGDDCRPDGGMIVVSNRQLVGEDD